MVVGISRAQGVWTSSEKLRDKVKSEECRVKKQRSTDEVKVNSNVFKKGMSMENLIINILEAAVFLLLGLGVSLLK